MTRPPLAPLGEHSRPGYKAAIATTTGTTTNPVLY